MVSKPFSSGFLYFLQFYGVIHCGGSSRVLPSVTLHRTFTAFIGSLHFMPSLTLCKKCMGSLEANLLKIAGVSPNR
jgi:hypothetical protein